MIDYTIGDKVVCISIEEDDFMFMIKHGLKNFNYPIVGQIYTVRDMCSDGELVGSAAPGVLLHEISGGVDKYDNEWWFEATSFRKVLPSEMNEERSEPAIIQNSKHILIL